MSDTQQGPDWWLASDSKWYPPQSRPLPPPPPPTPPQAPPQWSHLPNPPTQPTAPPNDPYRQAVQPPYMPTRPPSVAPGLSTTIEIGMWCGAAICALIVILGFAAGAKVQSWNGRFTSVQYENASRGFIGATGFGILLYLVMFVLLIIWTWKAAKASEVLQSGPRTWRAGWAIGSWFIPFASLVIPFLVIGEVDKIAQAPRVDGRADSIWHSTSTSAIGHCWWWGHVGALVLWQIVTMAFPMQSAGRLISQSLIDVVMGLSAVFGALFVRQLSKRLSPTVIDEALAEQYAAVAG